MLRISHIHGHRKRNQPISQRVAIKTILTASGSNTNQPLITLIDYFTFVGIGNPFKGVSFTELEGMFSCSFVSHPNELNVQLFQDKTKWPQTY